MGGAVAALAEDAPLMTFVVDERAEQPRIPAVGVVGVFRMAGVGGGDAGARGEAGR